MKPKIRTQNVQDVNFDRTLLWKREKNIISLLCKIVAKIGVTKIKNNMKRPIFIYT
jgi:hypothetical protein